ncbi:MAG: cation:proton antiporter, partial [Candidatus Diapherotrites archaeon]|nr:cation:proton antiporter [Candidatus Diapherotrites archaeon]
VLFIAFASKLVGCGVPTLLKLPVRKALVVGAGMVPRIEIALVIMGTALAAGRVGQDAYSAFIVVAIATVFLTPWIINMLYEGKKRKRL